MSERANERALLAGMPVCFLAARDGGPVRSSRPTLFAWASAQGWCGWRDWWSMACEDACFCPLLCGFWRGERLCCRSRAWRLASRNRGHQSSSRSHGRARGRPKSIQGWVGGYLKIPRSLEEASLLSSPRAVFESRASPRSPFVLPLVSTTVSAVRRRRACVRACVCWRGVHGMIL